MKKALIVIILLVFISCPYWNYCPVAAADSQHYRNATMHYLAGELNEALNEVRVFLAENPRHNGALKLMRQIVKEMEVLGIKPAYIVKKQAEEQLSKQKSQYLSTGKMLYNQGSYSAAIEQFKQLLLLDPQNKEAVGYLKKIQNYYIVGRKGMPANYRAAILSLFSGFICLGLLLSLSAVMLERRLIRKKEEKESSPLCFKCKAKLPPNADVCPYCGAQVGLRMWHTISEEQRTWYAGLSWIKNPFSLDCHPELFTGYKKEVKEILEKVNVKSGHVLITGPLGMGKTTMLRWMSAYLPKKRNPIYIARPPQHFSELLRYIVQTLHFPPGEMQEYNIYNLDKLRKKMGGELVLLLDEAHEFTIDIERPLRTLGDLDDVTLVMAGLPETIDKFKKEIQPLYDRLVLVVNLTSMEFESFRELIKTRIEDAGGQGIHPFSLAALEKIYAISKGNPRMALKLCDAAVTRAMNKGEDRIGEEIVQTDEFAAMKIQ